jgi:hypothetical protein
MSEVAEEYAQGFIKEDSVATIGWFRPLFPQ